MQNLLLDVFSYLSLGAVVGFLSGLLGVGGGGILVPILASIFSYRFIGGTNYLQVALATSLACSIPTTAMSTYTHHKKGAVQWRIVKFMGVGVIIGSGVGVMIATRIQGVYLAAFFCLFMLFAAIKLFSNWQPKPKTTPISINTTVLTGAVIGCVSALISVGGAFFTVLYLTYNNVELKKAIGTSSAIGFLAVLFSTVGYALSNSTSAVKMPAYSMGYVYLPAVVLVVFASLLLVPVGTNMAHKLDDKKLKKIFGVLCILLSLKMLVSMLP
ncbi:sulfite exporter TauE/SafE family protein [Psychrobacter sp. HD31]|uniref:sulfite exporter TauE/SafE family protein n=1 Tax=Psychrobacter sp. HD31 TaxID=3112003 RepID=UPI003DA60B93